MTTGHVSVLTAHIREHAARYFPMAHAGQMSVQMIAEQKRPSAILYRFKVMDGAQTYSIIVKVPIRGKRDRPAESVFKKPLLFPKAEPTEMHSLQYSALSTIHAYFTSLGKEQFGAIRVLDHLPEAQAVVMEESRDPKLRQLLYKEGRLRSPFARYQLTSAFHNAGTWLRLYHSMPKEEHVQVRHQSREDYVEAVIKLTHFLADSLGDKRFFDRIAMASINAAREILPELLPLGLGHGDYAMRNILVGPNARITVLDTFAKWRTPIYEDIGYFLTELKMTYPQVISQGLLFSRARLNAYEQAFLKGYFDQKDIPYPAIRLYEILALLDKWGSILGLSYRRTGKLKLAGRGMAALASGYFKRSIKLLLGEMTNTKIGTPSLDPERRY